MSVQLQEQLSPADDQIILGQLPDRIREALVARAVEIEYPVEAVVEMAIKLRFASPSPVSLIVKH
nr:MULTISPECIES: hypothetical protein [unclassified Roseofilum]